MQDGQIQLWLNPEQFGALPARQQIGVLLHEYLHLTLCHCSKRSFGDKQQAWLANVAQDMAINPVIMQHYDLPEGSVFPDSAGYSLPRFQSAEFYFNELVRDQQRFEQAFGPPPAAPSYELFGPLSRIAEDFARTHNSSGSGLIATACGSPELVQSITRQYGQTIDWRSHLRDFFRRAGGSTYRPSYKRQNRRLGLLAPDKKLQARVFVPVILDTSASMEPHIKIAVEEILALADQARLQLFQCDTRLINVAELGWQDQLKVIGLGGTDLQPAFDMIWQAGHQSCLCISDEEFISQPDTHGLRVTWWNPKNCQIRSSR